MGRLKSSLAIVLFYLALIVPTAVLAANPPEIKSVLPKEIVAGKVDGGQLRIRIVAKKKFTKDSVVQVNGTDLPLTNINFQSGDILALIPDDLISQPGTISISVRS